ncbi:MAG: hypothetical protein WC949_02180 [Candidatus Paceibacterota bacterium]|jgi:flagellar basal body-associated protein FliL
MSLTTAAIVIAVVSVVALVAWYMAKKGEKTEKPAEDKASSDTTPSQQ